MGFKFTTSLLLKESIMLLIVKCSGNISLPHPCCNLPVSLRGASYGSYHKTVTWKLPESLFCGNRSTCNHSAVVLIVFLGVKLFIAHKQAHIQASLSFMLRFA